MEMQGKNVVVAGGAGGLGRTTARLMAERGARIALIDRNGAALEETLARLGGAGTEALAIEGRIEARAEAERLFARAVAALGRVHALVNCVGVYPRRPILEISDADWHESLSVNVVGIYNLAAAAVAHMREQEPEDDVRGRIVNISSIDAFKAHPANAHYAASKAAVVSLTRSFALAFAPDKILVNSVAPAAIATERAKAADWMAAHIESTPLGRAAEPEDIAETICFLASSRNRYTTGENIIVSGGYLVA